MSLYKIYDMETMTQDKLNELALERNNLAKEIKRTNNNWEILKQKLISLYNPSQEIIYLDILSFMQKLEKMGSDKE